MLGALLDTGSSPVATGGAVVANRVAGACFVLSGIFLILTIVEGWARRRLKDRWYCAGPIVLAFCTDTQPNPERLKIGSIQRTEHGEFLFLDQARCFFYRRLAQHELVPPIQLRCVLRLKVEMAAVEGRLSASYGLSFLAALAGMAASISASSSALTVLFLLLFLPVFAYIFVAGIRQEVAWVSTVASEALEQIEAPPVPPDRR